MESGIIITWVMVKRERCPNEKLSRLGPYLEVASNASGGM